MLLFFCDCVILNFSLDNVDFINVSFVFINIEKLEWVWVFMGLCVYRVVCGNEYIVVFVEGCDVVDFYLWGMNFYG